MITLLAHRHTEKRVVLPKASGIEDRDTDTYPIPPRTNLALVWDVVRELRECGHAVECEVHHEKLVDWTATHAYHERSWGLQDGWRPDPKAPTVLRFVAGGCDILVTVDGRQIRLTRADVALRRADLRILLAGRL